MGHKAAEIHSNRSLAQRREALSGFKNGRYRVLVATDIAARGIDVSGIELVLNYDLPDNSEDYVHRIGRTGRAGKAGRAVSFVLPGQLKEIKNIERLIKKNISVTGKAAGVEAEAKQRKKETPEMPGRGRRPERTGGSRRPERSGRPRNNDFISAFNPFKEEAPAPDRKTFQKGGKKRFGKFDRSGKPGRDGRRQAHPQESKYMTDKQRFRKSMSARVS
jgi:superfamily II DNA/RNA helicase